MSEGALARLVRHGWPGNVRELRNVVEQAAVLAPGDRIEESDLRLGVATPGEGKAIAPGSSFAEAKRQVVDHFERTFLTDALALHHGNVSQTAAAIGMVRQSLQQKLKELGLRADDHQGD